MSELVFIALSKYFLNRIKIRAYNTDPMERTIPAAAKELGITPSALYAAIERQEVIAVERLGKKGLTEKEFEKFKLALASRIRRGPKSNGEAK